MNEQESQFQSESEVLPERVVADTTTKSTLTRRF